MKRNFRAGTRNSPLALKQVDEILRALRKFYPDIGVEIINMATYGDMDKTTPISQVEGSDFFTREIDEALLRGDIDFAVHSAKDLPDEPRKGLSIAAVTNSIDPYDVLVSKSGLKLEELPRNAKIGTSSLRRKEALKNFRQDFRIVDLRGNIEERLKILDTGGLKGLDAIVIASAGLIRLGLEGRVTQKIPFDILKPHPMQGALAVEIREGDKELTDIFSKLDTRKGAAV